MSYSFSIKANTKAEVVARVEAELSQVVASQPSHAADRQAAQDAIKAFIAVVKDPDEGGYVQVSVSGSLSWQTTDLFTSASVNISVYVGL